MQTVSKNGYIDICVCMCVCILDSSVTDALQHIYNIRGLITFTIHRQVT